MLLLNCSLLSQVPITWTISILFSNDSKLMDPPFSPTLVQLSKRFQPPMPLTINSSAIPFSFYMRRRSPHLLLSNCLMTFYDIAPLVPFQGTTLNINLGNVHVTQTQEWSCLASLCSIGDDDGDTKEEDSSC